MKARVTMWIAGGAAALLLAACGEKSQALDAGKRKVDAKSWDSAGSQYLARGWQGGDQKSWEEQLRYRAQAQNEYARDK